MIVRLDWPDAKLWPNRSNGKHWSATSAIRAHAKADAYHLTLQKAWETGYAAPQGTIALSLVLVPPDNRKRDLDGCLSACKSLLDGVAMALGVDDQVFRPLLINVGPVGKPGAVIVAVGVKIVVASDL